jgi:hypothetical protein
MHRRTRPPLIQRFQINFVDEHASVILPREIADRPKRGFVDQRPVGLCRLVSTMSRVCGVIFRSTSSGSTRNPSSIRRSK